jgi:crossover junction endodeoxyribonuclease RuvC
MGDSGDQVAARLGQSALCAAGISSHATDLYLGIDPGLVRTGYALLERSVSGPVLREGGVIRSTSKLSLAERVYEIAVGMRELFDEFGPQVMAIEQVFSLSRNPKSALLMAHARGAILFTAAERKVPVVHFSPTQVKRMLTGSGRAPKQQIQEAIKRELNLDRLLEPNDVADASAVALCLYHNVRFAA